MICTCLLPVRPCVIPQFRVDPSLLSDCLRRIPSHHTTDCLLFSGLSHAACIMLSLGPLPANVRAPVHEHDPDTTHDLVRRLLLHVRCPPCPRRAAACRARLIPCSFLPGRSRSSAQPDIHPFIHTYAYMPLAPAVSVLQPSSRIPILTVPAASTLSSASRITARAPTPPPSPPPEHPGPCHGASRIG